MLRNTYNAYPKNRISGLRGYFAVVDQKAKAEMVPAASSQTPISNLSQLTNDVTEQTNHINTLERGRGYLNGNGIYVNSSDLGEIAWESDNESDDSAYINESVTFYKDTGDYSSYAFTLIFDNLSGDFLRDFDLDVYKDDTLIVHEEVRGNLKVKYISKDPADNYNKVIVTAKRTCLPRQRARIIEFRFGVHEIITPDRVKSVHIVNECSPLCESIPSNEIRVVIDNSMQLYNLVNPKGFYKYLQDGQIIYIEGGTGNYPDGKIEYLPMGTFYYSKTRKHESESTAEVIGYDKIYSMDEGSYTKGQLTKQTLKTVLEWIFEPYNVELDIPDNIASRIIPAGIYDKTPREALQMAVQAAMCTGFMGRDNKFKIKDFQEGEIVQELKRNQMHSNATIDVLDPVNTIEVPAVDISTVSGFANTKLLYSANISLNGEQAITAEYNDNADPDETTIVATPGSVLVSAEKNIKSATIKLRGTGTVNINITAPSKITSQTVFYVSNKKTSDDERARRFANQLIESDAADTFGNWLLLQLEKRVDYTINEPGNLARELIDTVKVHDEFGSNRPAIEYKQEWTFETWWKLTSKMRGGGVNVD